MNKKVLCCHIEIPDEYNFSELLLTKSIFNGKSISYGEKQIELSHIGEKGEVIMGMFVTTQVKNIPPVHKPGNENDYSAVILGDGKGLAYPNVVLFDKKRKILFWEVNRLGITESAIQYFFDEIIRQSGYVNFSISIYPVMSMDAYAKINKLVSIDEVEFQIVNPRAYLKQESRNGTLVNIANIANDLNASKIIKITVKAEDLSSLNKSGVLKIANFFRRINLAAKSRSKNKLVVKGPLEEDGTYVEETINFMSNRMIGYFNIDEPSISSHLQIGNRKSGIMQVYLGLVKDLIILLG